MVLKYSFEIFFLKCIFEFMKNTAPYKGSNSVNGGERYFNIINFNKQLAQWLHCRVVRGCTFFAGEVLRGYFRFFFSFIVFLPFGFLLFILTADPVSFARFFRKHISSRGGTITAILYEEKKGTSGLRKTCPHRPQ